MYAMIAPPARVGKLFYRHVTDQTKLKCGDILWDRVLFHGHRVSTEKSVAVIIVKIFEVLSKSTKRIRTVKTPKSFHAILHEIVV